MFFIPSERERERERVNFQLKFYFSLQNFK